MNPLLQNLALIAVGLLMFGLPGYAVRRLLARLAGGGRALWTQDGPLGVALESLGLSLALWPILVYYLSQIGLRVGPLTLWAILIISAAIALVDLIRYPARITYYVLRITYYVSHPISYAIRNTQYVIRAAPLALVALTALALAARFYAVRDLQIPLFGDSLHHTVIVQLIINQGGIPTTYRPFAPVDHYTYHFGFHTLAAVWAQLTGMPAWGAVIAVGQILNALAVPAAYYLGRELFRSRLAGLFAALATGFISGMPTYYVNWGRYTQLAGQVLLPFALVWFMRAVDRPARRWRIGPAGGGVATLATGGGEPWKISQWRGWAGRLGLAVLGAAGLFFTHYRIMIFYALFVLAYLVVETLRGSIAYRARLGVARRMPRAYLRNLAGGWIAFLRGLYSRAAILGGLGTLLVLPWLLNLSANYLQILFQHLSTVSADYLAVYNANEYLGKSIGVALPALAGLGFVLLVAGAIQAIRSGHTAATATGGLWHGARMGLLIGLWTALLVLSAIPGAVGLPGSGAISTFTVGIMLYLPFSALAGAALAWGVEAGALGLRAWGPRLPATLTGRLALVLPLVLALGLLARNPGALNTDAYNADGTARTAYVAPADLHAMEWIKAHTPSDALFLIGSQSSYTGRAVTGTDAGMWIPLLTGRHATLPPLVTGSENGSQPLWDHARIVAAASHDVGNPASLKLLHDDGVGYAYLGALRPTVISQTLDLAALRADLAHFQAVYAQENVYIFAIK